MFISQIANVKIFDFFCLLRVENDYETLLDLGLSNNKQDFLFLFFAGASSSKQHRSVSLLTKLLSVIFKRNEMETTVLRSFSFSFLESYFYIQFSLILSAIIMSQ